MRAFDLVGGKSWKHTHNLNISNIFFSLNGMMSFSFHGVQSKTKTGNKTWILVSKLHVWRRTSCDTWIKPLCVYMICNQEDNYLEQKTRQSWAEQYIRTNLWSSRHGRCFFHVSKSESESVHRNVKVVVPWFAYSLLQVHILREVTYSHAELLGWNWCCGVCM